LKPKYSCVTTKIDNTQIKINGIAKGSGMISPNMATMLSYIFTDANIKSNILQQILSDISERTFNAITVDSDQSTNDTVMLFATNKAGNKEITDINSPLLKEFKNKLEELMLDLSKQIVIDGEGATKLIEIEVKGASSQEAAKNIAFQVANSPLVKTAIAGEDPNWGRIVMAIGKSQEQINQDDLDIKIGDFNIVKNGSLSSNYKEDQVHQYLKNDTIKIDINLQKDNGSAFTVWTCDLTEGYIKINKDYRS
jgi:glutamate N-acetyltransferase/amino-acid N-acetyltransferase